MSSQPQKPILIREVWSHNLVSEFSLLSDQIDRYPIVSMDTEFPGQLFKETDQMGRYVQLPPNENYLQLKSNVDALNLIQLGLTLTDEAGNLPDLGSHNNRYTWQFNFSDFDVNRDRHSPKAINFLRTNGIDFDQLRAHGIDSARFVELIMPSGLILNKDVVTWVAFQGGYDFAYLIKVITRRHLPPDLRGFMKLVKIFFGPNVYDVKYLMNTRRLFGGLETVAKSLGVKREAGRAHQAGSDCLLTWHVFEKMRARYFGNNLYQQHAGVLAGLQIS